MSGHAIVGAGSPGSKRHGQIKRSQKDILLHSTCSDTDSVLTVISDEICSTSGILQALGEV